MSSAPTPERASPPQPAARRSPRLVAATVLMVALLVLLVLPLTVAATLDLIGQLGAPAAPAAEEPQRYEYDLVLPTSNPAP